MTPPELRETVLSLKRVVAKLVVWRERLAPEGGVRTAVAENVDEREEFVEGVSTLVLMGVADDQAVRQIRADHRVPFADTRANVLENRVVRIREVQEVRRERLPTGAIPERAR